MNTMPATFFDFNITITHGPVLIRGISFIDDGSYLFRLNYQPKLSRLPGYTQKRASRDLTIYDWAKHNCETCATCFPLFGFAKYAEQINKGFGKYYIQFYCSRNPEKSIAAGEDEYDR